MCNPDLQEHSFSIEIPYSSDQPNFSEIGRRTPFPEYFLLVSPPPSSSLPMVFSTHLKRNTRRSLNIRF